MAMKLSTGAWVSGPDFFDRKIDLELLEERIRGGNHILLTGQRRMGKTSIARELGRRLEEGQGWSFLFVDVEDASCEEDVIADIAQATHSIQGLANRVVSEWRRRVRNIEEIGVVGFRMKIREALNPGNWQRHGTKLIKDCADHESPVFLVIDELPIFLKRVLREDQESGHRRVEIFLSWLRRALSDLGDRAPVVMVSGSIGLAPLVNRLGISDRINYLHPYRLQPWNRETSVACFERLATDCGLSVDPGVATAVYERLGIGIPFHLQSFFARIQEFAATTGRDRVTVEDVGDVYRTRLLGPAGQNDLMHYETRLQDTIDSESYGIAMDILAETAMQGVFTPDARSRLEQRYCTQTDDVPARIAEVLDILEHDGYLSTSDAGYRFESNLLRDWWSGRQGQRRRPVSRRHRRTADS